MTNQNCSVCEKTKAPFQCGICQVDLCKDCVVLLEEDTFAFLSPLPEDLKHSYYCNNCHHEKVAPQLAQYQELMEKAKDINVYEKKQGKETRYMRRQEKPVRVVDCPDYEEALLRLAFFAAQGGFNAILDVEITPKKVKIGKYQSTVYSGSGVPANIEKHQIVRDRSIWQNPN